MTQWSAAKPSEVLLQSTDSSLPLQSSMLSELTQFLHLIAKATNKIVDSMSSLKPDVTKSKKEEWGTGNREPDYSGNSHEKSNWLTKRSKDSDFTVI